MEIGDVATWAGAIFTAATFIAAFWQISTERKIRKKTQQHAESERIRSQAVHVSTWIVQPSGFPMYAAVLNKSNEPVYEVIISLVGIQGAFPHDAHEVKEYYPYRSFLNVLPPGRFYISIPSAGHGMSTSFALEISFTDSSGHHWVRKGNGKLIKITQCAIDYYNIPRPVGWEYPSIENIEEIKKPSK
jgi:hypothetical protein